MASAVHHYLLVIANLAEKGVVFSALFAISHGNVTQSVALGVNQSVCCGTLRTNGSELSIALNAIADFNQTQERAQLLVINGVVLFTLQTSAERDVLINAMGDLLDTVMSLQVE